MASSSGSSSRVQLKDHHQWALLAGVGVASSALTSLAIFTYQSSQRRRRRRDLRDKVHRATTAKAASHDLDDDDDNDDTLTLPRTPHPPGSPRVSHHSQSSSRDGGTPRYLSQLQLQAAATAASHNQAALPHRPPTVIPPPLLPKPHRTASSSSLRSSNSMASSAMSSSLSAATMTPSKYSQTYPESLIREQLARHYSFFSPATMRAQRAVVEASQQQDQQPAITVAPSKPSRPENDEQELPGLGMSAIRSAYVVVVGLGGVGSHAALALLRSGISHIRLIDFDQVSLSSLNRHACATLSDVGRSKVTVCAEKFMAIAPWATVEPCNELFRAAEAKRLLTTPRKPDFIIDAIDNIDTKVDLIAYAYNNQIRIITASGAGAKSDPSRIQIADLSATSEDPLARAVRRRLRMVGVPKIRDKVADNHGTPPRARTAKKQERKAEAASQPRPPSPPPPSQAQSSRRNSALTSPSPVDVFSTPASTPFTEEAPAVPGSESTTANSGNSEWTLPSPARNTMHSRRASSTSSMGNGRYETPLMSPSEMRSGTASRDGTVGETAPPFKLEAALKGRQQKQDSFGDGQDPEQGEAEPQAQVGQASEDNLTDQGVIETRSTTRKHHAQALTPTNLQRAALEVDPSTGYRLTLPCVFSTEKSDVRLLDLPESEVGKGRVEELAALEDFRVRVLPVLGPIPAMFGLAVATYVLCEIAGWPMEPLPFLNRRKMYERILSDLEVCERRYPSSSNSTSAKSATPNEKPKSTSFSLNDIAYITEEVFHSRSCIPPFNTLASATSASLMRWDSTLPLGFNNVVLLSKEEGKQHAREVLQLGRSPWEVWGREAAEAVKRRMAAERRMNVFR